MKIPLNIDTILDAMLLQDEWQEPAAYYLSTTGQKLLKPWSYLQQAIREKTIVILFWSVREREITLYSNVPYYKDNRNLITFDIPPF